MTGQPGGQPGIHRLRANHREWAPPQYIAISTRTRVTGSEQGEVHSLRCWSAQLRVRRAGSADGIGDVAASGTDDRSLAQQVDHWCAGQKTMWAYSHSISFDLSVTRIPVQLQALGWNVTAHAVASESPWLRMRRGRCVITFADSWGWLRAPLPAIAADLGMSLPRPGGDSDSDAYWQALCDGDAAVTLEAMSRLMDWWEARELGNWTLTSSAAGWNSYRHLSPGPLPLIIPGNDENGHDRRAIYGGRREAFRHGTPAGGPWLLLDFQSAYPTIAASMPLPVQREGQFSRLDLDSPIINGESHAVIAEVQVETSVPRFPVRAAGRVAYPTGLFTTTLAGPEIAEARRLGCLRAIGPGRLHRLSDHLADWARWVLLAAAGMDSGVPEVARRAVRHWGRAVIGKFAAHGFITQPLGTLAGNGWIDIPGWNAAYQAPSHLTEVCGQAAEVIQHGDGENAYPAVLAFVESWTRVYLNRAIEAIGRQHVLMCDTDGLAVDVASNWEAAIAGTSLGPLRLRVKEQWTGVRVIGPQHIMHDDGRKMAGMPRTATDCGDGKFEALLWPKLAAQMALRPGADTPGYVRPRATYTLPQTTITGCCHEDGTVTPLHAATCAGGQLHLDLCPPGAISVPALEEQAAHLRPMINPLPSEGQPCSHQSSRSHGTDSESSQLIQTGSSMSSHSPDNPTGRKRRSWPLAGVTTSGVAPRESSGWTRILWLTRKTSRTCGRK